MVGRRVSFYFYLIFAMFGEEGKEQERGLSKVSYAQIDNIGAVIDDCFVLSRQSLC